MEKAREENPKNGENVREREASGAAVQGVTLGTFYKTKVPHP